MKKSKKARKKKLDNLWSKIIKQRAGNRCEYCGETNHLNAHHFFSRRHNSLRYSLDNGFCLCAGCHINKSDQPDFIFWAVKNRGQGWYELLCHWKEQIIKLDLDLIEDYLKGKLNREVL